MPATTGSPPRNRPSGGERMFEDAGGNSWIASHFPTTEGGVIEFACVNDPRQPVCAIAVDNTFSIASISDDALRKWLREAPRIGRLT